MSFAWYRCCQHWSFWSFWRYRCCQHNLTPLPIFSFACITVRCIGVFQLVAPNMPGICFNQCWILMMFQWLRIEGFYNKLQCFTSCSDCQVSRTLGMYMPKPRPWLLDYLCACVCLSMFVGCKVYTNLIVDCVTLGVSYDGFRGALHLMHLIAAINCIWAGQSLETSPKWGGTDGIVKAVPTEDPCSSSHTYPL